MPNPLAALSTLTLAAAMALTMSPAGDGEDPLPNGAPAGLARNAFVPDGPALAARAALSHGAVLADTPADVYLCVTLDAATPPTVRRPDMNLALVLDRSGSMASEGKLTAARAAADQLVEQLRPSDTLALVAYDHEVATVVPSTGVGDRGIFHAAIAALASGGSTDLHAGMLAGYEEVLATLDDERVNRVLLVSDGLANHGVTDRERIVERAERCRARGVRISTMGVGLSFDEDLLVGIAGESGGNYHYIDHAEGIGPALERELEGLARLVARDVRVTVQPGAGVEVHEVIGHPHVVKNGGVEIAVADLVAGEQRSLVLRLRVPAGAAVERLAASVSVQHESVATGASHRSAEQAVRVRATRLAAEVPAHEDLAVLSRVEVVRNALALDTAMEHQKRGDVDAAKRLLSERVAASRAVNDSRFHSDDVTRILARMDRVIDQLERTRHDRAAGRDLQLAEQLEALGYLSR